LWIGKRRSEKTLRRGLKELGPEFVKGLRFVCSDMWKPYLKVIADQAGQALHVLDRFHITMHMNQAVDEVRRTESTRLRAKSKDQAKRLKNMRWSLLRKGSRVRGHARDKLNALLASNLATARPWELKEVFQHFWKYNSILWASAFLDYWCKRAMRSRLEPIKKVARMLRAHEDLLMNWFRAKGEISSGAVEGLNNKTRVVTRRSFGFRTYTMPWKWPCITRLDDSPNQNQPTDSAEEAKVLTRVEGAGADRLKLQSSARNCRWKHTAAGDRKDRLLPDGRHRNDPRSLAKLPEGFLRPRGLQIYNRHATDLSAYSETLTWSVWRPQWASILWARRPAEKARLHPANCKIANRRSHR